MPEVEFTIDTATGEFQMHVQGVAGPACDDVAKLVKDLAGEPGRVRDAVLLNAAAALAVYDEPSLAVEEALPGALERAAEAVDSGAAESVLVRWVAASAD